MPVNKGFLSIVENEPNFSNQALENAVNDIKAVDKDDGHQFILSQFLLDTAIRNNPVLTTSQKNDVLETTYAAQPHLQIGRILTDVVRHTASIIDATIVPVPADETQTETFLGILQNVQAMQSLIPELYGVPAKDKGRAVNDHLGTLNNIFLTTEDSSAPVFTRLKRIMELIDANSRVTSALNLAVTNAATANLNLRTFLTTITDDSTDFQETLDNRVNSIVSMFSTLNTRIAQIPGDPTTDLVAIKDEITDQVSLENRNLADLSTTIDTLSDNLSYSSLAEDDTLRGLMSTVAQNKQWQTYFENYENEKDNLNPIYTTDTDSDKSSVIDQVLAGKGLPDVLDSTDLDAVAAKARRDTRIDTAFFDSYTSEQQIIKSCEQLGITTQYRNINSLSGTLLTNMNQHDRDTVANELDQNQSADTLS
tara:strand:- start:15 stop:1283 length:1269 start_codon:yes stop_codon:yes gene_type:complete